MDLVNISNINWKDLLYEGLFLTLKFKTIIKKSDLYLFYNSIFDEQKFKWNYQTNLL